DDDDGKIAGNAVTPEVRLRQGVAGERLGAGAGDVRAEHARCDARTQHREVVGDAQVLQGHARVRERYRQGARGRADVAVLADQRLRGLAAGGHAGGDGDPHERTGRETDAAAQGGDRIEDGASRTG